MSGQANRSFGRKGASPEPTRSASRLRKLGLLGASGAAVASTASRREAPTTTADGSWISSLWDTLTGDAAADGGDSGDAGDGGGD